MSRSLFARLNQRYGRPVDAFTRREMLKATLAGSAGLLLSRLPAFAQEPAAKAKPNGKSIVVIGAGFSGLACAHELLAAGYDVTVVEARNRVSGRVLSFSDVVPGKNVEGGGELMKEIDRRFKVSDLIIRHLVVRVDEEQTVIDRTRTKRSETSRRRRIARGLPPDRAPGEGQREMDDDRDDRFDMAEVDR